MMTCFLNPYNFVRSLPKPHKEPDPASDPDAALLWRCPPPTHDRMTGLSGEITVQATAVTPVFVSDSEAVRKGEKDHKTYRFFQVTNPDGSTKDVIPPTSLRGAVRSVFEAVTNSTWAVFADQQLSFRETASGARGLIPAVIMWHDTKKEWSVRLMPGTSVVGSNGEPQKGDPVYAAWVPSYKGRQTDLQGWRHGSVCAAVLAPKLHNNPTFNYWEVKAIGDPNSQDLAALKQRNPTWIICLGVLCITRENINRKHDERFFFIDDQKRSAKHPVHQEVIDRYNASLRQIRELHRDAIQKGEQPGPGFEWSRHVTESLSDEEINPENPYICTAGFRMPVYVRLVNNSVDYIAPVAVPRVPEKRTLAEVLRREGFDHLLPSTDFDRLSPADRVFGWVSQDADEQRTSRVAYKGRVRFSHACVIHNAGVMPKMTLAILSTPKPTTTRFYVDPQGGPADGKSDDDLRYGKPGNMLRGRKFYRHHGNKFKGEEATVRERSNQNRTITGAHNPGTEYEFTVSFENLQPVELGALLWSLRLSDEGWQGHLRIGFAKPLGLGSLKMEMARLALVDPSTRYGEAEALLAGGGTTDGMPLVEGLIETFKQALGQLYGTDFDHLPNVRDLCALLGDPQGPPRIHYPRPSRQPGTGDNYKWFMDNKRDPAGPSLMLLYAVDDQGFPYLRARKEHGRWVVDKERCP
jgi:CRISPR-associated protein (TIGR03986 family)